MSRRDYLDWVEAGKPLTEWHVDQFVAMFERADKAEAELEQLRADKERLGWQPIETAPKDGTGVWATDGRWQCEAYYWEPLSSWRALDAHGYGSYAVPTHWMPLPEAPKSNAERDTQ